MRPQGRDCTPTRSSMRVFLSQGVVITVYIRLKPIVTMLGLTRLLIIVKLCVQKTFLGCSPVGAKRPTDEPFTARHSGETKVGLDDKQEARKSWIRCICFVFARCMHCTKLQVKTLV